MTRRRGISLVEVVLASFLLLLALAFVSTLIGNVSQYESSLQQRAVATQLAQYQMDQILHTPIQKLNLAGGYFTDPGFTNYQYTMSFQPTTSATLQEVILTVIAPDNHTYTVSTVMPIPAGSGAAVVPISGQNYVYYPDPTYGVLRHVNVSGPIHPAALPPIAAMPSPAFPAGLAYSLPNQPSGNPYPGLWVANGDGTPTDTMRVFVLDVTSNTWVGSNWPEGVQADAGAWAGAPAGGLGYQVPPINARDGHISGQLVYGDQANHGNWTLTFPSDWKGVTNANGPQIGTIVAVAAVPNKFGAWLCDGPNQCLRFDQTWDPDNIESTIVHPSLGPAMMGTPRGIACDGDGENVWIVDDSHIWCMSYPLNGSTQWPSTINSPMPIPVYRMAPLVFANSNDVPTGLCWDGAFGNSWVATPPDGTHLWLSTTSGALYEIDPNSLTSVQFYP